jgi:hypothetical protein
VKDLVRLPLEFRGRFSLMNHSFTGLTKFEERTNKIGRLNMVSV